MLILPMVGVLHRALTAIARLGKSKIRKSKKAGANLRQKLLAKRTKENVVPKGIPERKTERRVRKLLNIVLAAKKKAAAAQNKRGAANKTPKRACKAKVNVKNLANAAPNAKPRKVARRARQGKARNQ